MFIIDGFADATLVPLLMLLMKPCYIKNSSVKFRRVSRDMCCQKWDWQVEILWKLSYNHQKWHSTFVGSQRDTLIKKENEFLWFILGCSTEELYRCNIAGNFVHICLLRGQIALNRETLLRYKTTLWVNQRICKELN